MMIFLIFIIVALLMFIQDVQSFRMTVTPRIQSIKSSQLTMEYIPDGLTKDQWEAIKKKEAEELKAKGNLGTLGVNRFKSRSFEAWQKSGAKHLFPTDPLKTPFEERPYMQRRGGDWEGRDLKQVGLEGKGQGTPSQRLKVDDYYEGQAKEGKLNSVSIFGGLPLPWTSDAAKKLNNNVNDPSAAKAVAGKKLSPQEQEKLKATLFKPIKRAPVTANTKSEVQKPKDEPPKKGFFGLF